MPQVRRQQAQAGRRLKTKRCRLALVEDQPPGRESHVRQDAVEGDSALLIRVKSLVKHVAQKSSILRDALADHATRVHDRVRIALDVGSEVADRGEPESPGHIDDRVPPDAQGDQERHAEHPDDRQCRPGQGGEGSATT